MAILGTRSVTLLRDAGPLCKGDTVDAEVWLNLDAYEPCAEVKIAATGRAEQVMLGRISSGGWEYADTDNA